MFMQNFIKLSAAVHELSTDNCYRTILDFDRKFLWNGSSNWQAENGVIYYNSSHVRWKQLGKLCSTNEKMTLTFDLYLEIPQGSCGWQGACSCKIHQAECSGSWDIMLTNVFALSRNGKESGNPILWLWPLTYDLEILWLSSGCQAPCSCKILSG